VPRGGLIWGTARRHVALALCCGAVAGGCGGSSHSSTPTHRAATTPKAVPVAARVCTHVLQAARAILGPATGMQIADADPANIECLISGGGLRLDAVAQASPRAWTQFDTVVVHQVQAFGTAGANNPQLPVDIPGPDSTAWIPSKQELVTTNGTQSTGGSYVTVDVTRTSKHAPSSLRVARAVGSATLAVAPPGPSPGPPPS
jgi:hypothetical protein